MARRKDSGGSTGVRRRLGRGLESLISTPVAIEVEAPPTPSPSRAGQKPPPGTPAPAPGSDAPAADAAPAIEMLSLDAVRPGPNQPRKSFDETALRSLGESIRRDGLMQPILVRPAAGGAGGPGGAGAGGGYEIVAGERRWRAAALAGLDRVPAIVRDLDDQATAELALVENLQREDLDPMERCQAFGRLADEFGMTHEAIAKRVGLDRSSVSNHIRLAELDDYSQNALRTGALGMGHGRALLAITNPAQRSDISRRAVADGWSVRELERQIRRALAASETPTVRVSRRSAHLDDLERRLGDHLGTKVSIQPSRKKGEGKLVLSFFSLDEFEGIVERLGFDPSS